LTDEFKAEKRLEREEVQIETGVSWLQWIYGIWRKLWR